MICVNKHNYNFGWPENVNYIIYFYEFSDIILPVFQGKSQTKLKSMVLSQCMHSQQTCIYSIQNANAKKLSKTNY